MRIAFKIDIEPVAKARHRKGKSGFYTPRATERFESFVTTNTLKAMGVNKFTGPVYVKVVFVRSIPKSWTKKKKAQALSGEIFPVSKPDLDNYAKAVLDGMNRIAFNDDSQVCDLMLRKIYGEEPSVTVEIGDLKNE